MANRAEGQLHPRGRVAIHRDDRFLVLKEGGL